jgi:phosphoribosylanthranilate isomerase
VTIAVKICGLTDAKAVITAVDAGANFVGFVFFRRSPRFLPIEAAADLVSGVPRTVTSVGLFVDPTDSLIEKTLKAMRLGLLQLHGKETPARVAAIRKKFNVPVMKAIGVAMRADVLTASDYVGVTDWLLFDAKPIPAAVRPGGNATAFDWPLMKAFNGARPWMLAGGLTARPGVKSPAKIRSFIKAVRAISG